MSLNRLLGSGLHTLLTIIDLQCDHPLFKLRIVTLDRRRRNAQVDFSIFLNKQQQNLLNSKVVRFTYASYNHQFTIQSHYFQIEDSRGGCRPNKEGMQVDFCLFLNQKCLYWTASIQSSIYNTIIQFSNWGLSRWIDGEGMHRLISVFSLTNNNKIYWTARSSGLHTLHTIISLQYNHTIFKLRIVAVDVGLTKKGYRLISVFSLTNCFCIEQQAYNHRFTIQSYHF